VKGSIGHTRLYDLYKYSTLNPFRAEQSSAMKVIAPSHEILYLPDEGFILRHIEAAGRVCYKSEDRITEDSAYAFVQRLLDSGHHSVLEHGSITVRFVCDRGISHELVRHRLASYSQESTRYANYSKNKFGNEITVIRPCFWSEDSLEYQIWLDAVKQAEQAYMNLIASGIKPEQARTVLPNSLKTEIIMTCSIREWRHVLSLRCAGSAHPQMREIMLPLLDDLHQRLPVFFADLYAKYRHDTRK